MRDPAHAAAAGCPQPDEGMPWFWDGKPWVQWRGLAADEPVAAVSGSQAAVIGAGVSGDSEGAPEFFVAS
jgi:hypothetical protein